MITKYRPYIGSLLVLFLFVGCKSKAEEVAVTAEPSAAPAASTPAPVETTPVPSTTAVETAPPAASVSAAPAATASATATATVSKTATAAKTSAPAAAAYTGDDPCTHKTLHMAQVREACRTGGRPAAKTLMKNMVKKAKETNPDIKCSSCHVDMKSFDLKDNALTDLKKLL